MHYFPKIEITDAQWFISIIVQEQLTVAKLKKTLQYNSNLQEANKTVL